MTLLSYRRHRFPPPIIQHAIWLYLRFTLSYRDVEELLAERGLEVSYETVRRWVLKFGPGFARRLRRSRPRPSDRWHLDEMVVRIAHRIRKRSPCLPSPNALAPCLTLIRITDTTAAACRSSIRYRRRGWPPHWPQQKR